MRPVKNELILFLNLIMETTLVVLYYDWLITLPDEIVKIWMGRWSGVTVCFLLNRYVPLLAYIPVAIGMFSPPWGRQASTRLL